MVQNYNFTLNGFDVVDPELDVDLDALQETYKTDAYIDLLAT